MRILLSVGLFFAIALLAGCASLSKAQCETGDWVQVGFMDGALGQTSSQFAEHQKACSEHGISVDRAQYMQGYQQGLQRYCTPSKAAEVGVAGRTYRNVCQGEKGVSFLRVYVAAKDVYAADTEIKRIQQEIEQITKQIADSATPQPERDQLARRLTWLNSDLNDAFKIRSREERELRDIQAQEEARLARL
ncbi:DUF2799 domain-containing protein [Maritalea mediterranea]|uniref:DUF2799 domain-containing protein n=1 Tax=Maritalea mediterranea TaxID=2909667 RepID=A0ABS9E392_9HYPH|nr:DUF2799 domain-containing protein [Maritalea mediterranea]MCF4097345.1 DUF2799 domain-containing protein [Maritalea mediterranea]